MTPTPRMKTHIRRDRYRMFSTVSIDHDGMTAVTTMRPDIKAGDLQIDNLKRQLANLPKIREDA